MSNASILKDVRTPYKHGKLVLEPSYKKSEFDSHAVDCPFTFYHNDKYYMTYVGWDSIGYRTGLAVSPDLEVWEKVGMIIDRGPRGSHTEFNIALTSIDERFASDPCVLWHDGYWLMFYFGVSSDRHARDGLAVSKNLKEWEKIDGILVDVGPDGSIDSKYAHKPSLIAKGKTVYHFYCAVSPAAETMTGEVQTDERRGISFARSVNTL
jgi:predicted GH43/DUF377 family glycosyl hydrolase